MSFNITPLTSTVNVDALAKNAQSLPEDSMQSILEGLAETQQWSDIIEIFKESEGDERKNIGDIIYAIVVKLVEKKQWASIVDLLKVFPEGTEKEKIADMLCEDACTDTSAKVLADYLLNKKLKQSKKCQTMSLQPF